MRTDGAIATLRGRRVHLTGIKGTGMAALAELLVAEGAVVTGSDVAERFYTDDLLAAIDLTPRVGFAADHLDPDVELLVYSAAYGPDNPEREAATVRGVEQLSYSEMLGALSTRQPSLAIAGVHGKTTTTAIAGALVAASGVPATVVVGSAVPDFGGSATLRAGTSFLIAETCEYRRHFLSFSPTVLVVTSIEPDHLDYFRDREDIEAAFAEFARRIVAGGTLVVCADDDGARRLGLQVEEARADVTVVRYGLGATGPGRVREVSVVGGRVSFTLGEPGTQYSMVVPGRHNVLNAAAALCALDALVGDATATVRAQRREALATFRGTRRRSELIGEAGGVVVYDDYGHHPTAIRATLDGFREFFPGQRIVVDFMSHTYSRSQALLDDFADAFGSADTVILNDIYASAREVAVGGIDGAAFAAAIAARHRDVRYRPEFAEAAHEALTVLRPGDVFITMGAGNNAVVGREVLAALAATAQGGIV